MAVPTFEDYLASLTDLATAHDPTVLTAEGAEIKAAAAAIAALADPLDPNELASLIQDHPEYVPALGYSVGLSREALKNTLKHHFDTSGWIKLAREQPVDVVAMFDGEYELIRLVEAQRHTAFDYGDILVARAGTRTTAAHAGERGRRIEDEIEGVAARLGLSYVTRTRFVGRGDDAPCDLAIPTGGQEALIVVAAKGFNSTGSKLSDAVREVEAMAAVRSPRQYVFAAIDGIGWKNRAADLKRIYQLWADGRIDGMYTLSSLDQFRIALEDAARRQGLLA